MISLNRVKLLFSVLLFSVWSTSGLHGQEESKRAESLFTKAEGFSKEYERDSAIWYYTSAAEVYLADGDSSGYFSSEIGVAFEYGNLGRFTEAYQILDRIIPLYKAKGRNRVKYEAHAAYGRIMEYEGKFGEAIEMAEIAIQSNYEPDSKEGKRRNARQLYRKGFSQFQARQFQESIKTMETSRAIFKELGSRIDEASVLSQMGSIMVQLLKADEALSYFNECKEIYSSAPDSVSLESRAILSLNIGEAYRNLELFPEAINNFLTSAHQFRQVLEDHQALTVVYPQLGFTYDRSGQFQEAIEYLQKGVALCLRYYGKANFRTITNQQILGIAYASNAEYDKAIEQFDNAIAVLTTDLAGVAPDILARIIFEKGLAQYKTGETNDGLNNMKEGIARSSGDGLHLIRQVTILSKRLGEIYLDLDKPNLAREYFQLALDINDEKVSESRPNPQMAFHFNRYESFLGKTASFEMTYSNDSETVWLDSAYAMLKKAEEEVSFFRQFPSRLSEQLNVGSALSESFNVGIRICYELFELTQKREYAEYAYRLIEQSKSNQAFFNTDNPIDVDLPESIKVRESKLNIYLSSLETLLYEELSKEEPDQEELSNFEKRIEDTTNEIILLSQQIRIDYPGYYQLKYDRKYLDIEQTQGLLLSESETLLNYHYNGDVLFLFQIDRSGFSFTKKKLDKAFEKSVFRFVQLLKTPKTDRETLSEYVKLSNTVSEVILSDLDVSALAVTVIPDGPLHLVPFGALLAKTDELPVSFRDLPYLIKDFNFRYATSASMLAKQMERKNDNNGAIAFAPSFSENKSLSDSVRGALGNLANTRQEVENIDRYFETDYFVDSVATERLFRNSVKEYAIVHLASHGVLDPINPLFSRLLFSPYNTDSINDGFLNTREILSMSIPAEMVVLSACNTGSGDLIRGEGVMSIANGFSYAGAKSLVMTLWSANDESTAKIMNSFYKDLSVGNTKSTALRKAKLTYLKEANSILAHPYFWAHFVVNGDDRPLVQKGWPFYYWLGLVLLAFSMLWLYRRARMSSNDGG